MASVKMLVVTTGRFLGARAIRQARSFGTFCTNETRCRRWWNISRKTLSTGTRTFTPSLSPMLTKEQQHFKESRELGVAKDTREPKHTKEGKDIKGTKDTKKSKDKSSASVSPEVTVEYLRGLPRITLPLPSRSQKCMFTLKPLTQTIGDFLDMLKLEDPTVVNASITMSDSTTYGTTNKIETLLLDDFNLIINDKVYPVSPPKHEISKENIRQLQDVQALVHQLYETFNARQYHAELERQVMLHLEEVRTELEPLEQELNEIKLSAQRRSQLATWGVLVFMSIQFGCLARLTWWEYSWDIMEPVTYFVTYATAMGCYIYFLMTRQEYLLPDVFNREYLIGVYKKARKVGFDLTHYNTLKEEAYELETMLKIIRGPLHIQQTVIEQKRQQRLEQSRSTKSSISSSSSSSSSSPSPSRPRNPSPEKTDKQDTKSNAGQ
ncbi:calcium uniporter protein, mitochondrial [Phymastichus coffea]|uniref:calcium uniporter protein, mitochondrial n=1 Tax=Phymastichus coffea TaxID=108790 RepID=UPI00273B1277|nr:calcium uniporter protein, mitochondrial [Phymastichus coffea]